MNTTQLKIGAFIAALGVAAATTHAFADTVAANVTQVANLPDTAQGDASPTTRQLISQPSLVWPHGVSQEREASVTLHYTIEPDGHVDNVRASDNTYNTNRQDTAFLDAAKAAVRGRVYTPAGSAEDRETVVKFHAGE